MLAIKILHFALHAVPTSWLNLTPAVCRVYYKTRLMGLDGSIKLKVT